MLQDILKSKKCFKFICAAGNKDCTEIEKLCTLYSLSGAQFFDIAADIDVIKSAKKGGANMVKSMVSSPENIAKTVGIGLVCCIPYLGPVVAMGLAGYGLYSGGKQIINAIEVAESATTDAEAKAAYENIGAGGLTVGLSAAGLKGSAGLLKRQIIKGTDTSAAVVRELADKEHTAGSVAKTAVEAGIKETAKNAAGVVESAVKKGETALNKGKDYLESAKKGTLKETVANDINATAKKAGEYVGEKVDKAKETIDNAKNLKNRKAQKAAAKEMAETEVYSAENTAKEGFEEAVADGRITNAQEAKDLGYEQEWSNYELNKKYTATEEVSKNGKVKSVEIKNNETGTIQKNKFASDGVTVKTRTITETSGNVSTTTETNLSTGVTNKTVSDSGITIKSETGVGVGTDSFTGVKTTMSGKKIWYENGTNMGSNPSLTTQARINYKSTNAGVSLDKFIGDGSTTIYGHTYSAKATAAAGVAAAIQDEDE